MNRIPLVDLAAAHEEVADEVAAGFARVMERTAFVGGSDVGDFEREYAAFSGVQHCVGVANGTDAIELALRAVGVGAGDEVIIPANTFIATAEAVARAGAKPVLVDCDPDSYLMNTEQAAAAVGRRTKAIVPVHLYGQLVPVEDLVATGLPVVEDAAQCHGATRDGRTAGSGGIAATSFYPGKNLGAYGDGGAVVTDDEDLAKTVRTLANHGGLSKYAHDVIGMNSRLDTLQAVVLRAKLTRLAAWNQARRAAAERYDKLLADTGVVLPAALPGNEHVWHLYVVRVDAFRRDGIVAGLNERGVGAGIHYPDPVHLTPAFAGLGYARGAFPHAERAAREILTLPLHPHLTEDQQTKVAEALAEELS